MENHGVWCAPYVRRPGSSLRRKARENGRVVPLGKTSRQNNSSTVLFPRRGQRMRVNWSGATTKSVLPLSLTGDRACGDAHRVVVGATLRSKRDMTDAPPAS